MAIAMIVLGKQYKFYSVRQEKHGVTVEGGRTFVSYLDKADEVQEYIATLAQGDKTGDELHVILDRGVLYKTFGIEAANMTFDPYKKLSQSELEDVQQYIKQNYAPEGFDVLHDYAVTIISLQNIGSEWFFTVAFTRTEDVKKYTHFAEVLGLTLFSIESDLYLYNRVIDLDEPYILTCKDKTFLTCAAGSLVFTGARYPQDVVNDVLLHKAADLYKLNFEKVIKLNEDTLRHVAKVEYTRQEMFEGTDLCAYLAISACLPEKLFQTKQKHVQERDDSADAEDISDDIDLMGGKKKVTKINVLSKLREFLAGF